MEIERPSHPPPPLFSRRVQEREHDGSGSSRNPRKYSLLECRPFPLSKSPIHSASLSSRRKCSAATTGTNRKLTNSPAHCQSSHWNQSQAQSTSSRPQQSSPYT